ncbi:MAG: hypothetical protein HY842_12335 [Bacteroidetes bacterium]|nr:hypothetical protein [Bacteroidota bacterium]
MEQKLEFNKQGLLVPHEGIQVDLETMEQRFVHDFPKSTIRKQLFENYLKYLSQLQSEVFPWFEQWVGGSFVTLKENPKDIDLVTLLDYRVFDLKEKVIERFYSFNWEVEGIDAYFMRVVPEGEPGYSISERDKELWFARFRSTILEVPKGFVTLVFENKKI